MWHFSKYGLEMSMVEGHNQSDAYDKTVYTSNREDNHEPQTIMYNNKPIPWMELSCSYKYLGVYINLDLN